MENKVRVQLDFAPQDANKLDDLKEAFGLNTRVDVIKYAMGLLDWVAEVRRGGWQLLLEKGDERRVVVLPFDVYQRESQKSTRKRGTSQQTPP